MPYCGHFGCSCCSRNCKKCGEMCWSHDLSEGICEKCRREALLNAVAKFLEAYDGGKNQEEAIEELRNIMD